MAKKLILILFISVICLLTYKIFIPKNIAVSVIIPTYNRAALLPRAIDSILNQTFQNFEIVIIDDASTDNTAQILKEYKKKSNKIKVITHEKNQGVAQARNTGNQHARGKYIALLDSDDYALPNFLETAVSFMEENPSVTIGFTVKHTYLESRKNKDGSYKIIPWHHPVYNFIDNNLLGNVGNIFRRDFIQKHQIKYNSKFTCGEDYHFWMQMIIKGATLAKIETETALIVFRAYGGNSWWGNCKYAVKFTKEKLFKNINYHPQENDDFCDILSLILKKHPNIFPLKHEQTQISKICPKETDIYVRLNHPAWKDYLIFSKNNRVYRNKTKDEATLLLLIPHKKIIIKWDKWGEETFIYNENQNRYIYSDKK